MENKTIEYGTERKVTVLSATDTLITAVDENNEGYLLVGHGIKDLPKEGDTGRVVFTEIRNPLIKGYWKYQTICFFIILSFFFSGCEFPSSSAKKERQIEIEKYKVIYVDFPDGGSNMKVYTVPIDSCEYLYTWFGAANGGGSSTHKGNCKFCAERNKILKND